MKEQVLQEEISHIAYCTEDGELESDEPALSDSSETPPQQPGDLYITAQMNLFLEQTKGKKKEHLTFQLLSSIR